MPMYSSFYTTVADDELLFTYILYISWPPYQRKTLSIFTVAAKKLEEEAEKARKEKEEKGQNHFICSLEETLCCVVKRHSHTLIAIDHFTNKRVRRETER